MAVIEKGLLFSSWSYSYNSVCCDRAILNLRQKVNSWSRISSILEKIGKPGLNPVKILIMLFMSVATLPSFLEMCFLASSASFPSLFPSRSYYKNLTYQTYAGNLNGFPVGFEYILIYWHLYLCIAVHQLLVIRNILPYVSLYLVLE